MSARATQTSEETEAAPEAPPEPETPAEALSEPEETTPEWASPEDLGGDRDWEETILPAMQKRVRIRYLSTPEVTQLAVLPDLVGFSKQASQLQDPDEEERAKVDTSKLVVDEKHYQARLAHVAIMASESLEEMPCDECGEDYPHPPALLSHRQAARLHPNDLGHITLVAVQSSRLRTARPFSNPETHPASPSPADSSA